LDDCDHSNIFVNIDWKNHIQKGREAKHEDLHAKDVYNAEANHL
jgi:hypothetical protein